MKIICRNSSLVFQKAHEIVNLANPNLFGIKQYCSSANPGFAPTYAIGTYNYAAIKDIPITEEGLYLWIDAFSNVDIQVVVMDSDKRVIRAYRDLNTGREEDKSVQYQEGDSFVSVIFRSEETAVRLGKNDWGELLRLGNLPDGWTEQDLISNIYANVGVFVGTTKPSKFVPWKE